MLIAGATAVLRIGGGVHPVVGLGIVFVGCLVTTACGWWRICTALRLPVRFAILGTALVLVNPFLLSALGMEVHLETATLVLLAMMAVERRVIGFGIVAGLAVLTRLDLIIVVLAVAASTPTIWRRLPRAALACAAVALPWYVLSWVSLGSAIPDTFVIKAHQHSFGRYTFPLGPLYYFNTKSADGTLLSFLAPLAGLVMLPAGMVRLRRARSERSRDFMPLIGLTLGGLAYYAVYTVMDVAPYQWYFVPTIVCLTVFVMAAGGGLEARTHSRGLKLLLSGAACALIATSVVEEFNRPLPWRYPIIFGNWATPADYARVGLELRSMVGGATVRAPQEIGTIAFFCQCRILDPFSDRGRVIPLITQEEKLSGSLTRALLQINYQWLDRTSRPAPITYRLRWFKRPRSGRHVWQVWSPAKGIGYLVLRRAR
jgi:hypothetical protein